MATLTLYFTPSTTEIEPGVPSSVAIDSNEPCVVYYTVDGSIPSTSSAIYIDPIGISDVLAVTINAFGVNADGYSSDLFTVIYATPNSLAIDRNRHSAEEGLVIDGYNAVQIPDGYAADGETTARFIDIDPETLDMMTEHTKHGFDGMGEGTAVDVGIPDPKDTAQYFDNSFVEYSTPLVAEYFDPQAKVIVIDNRLHNELDITLRPYGSFERLESEFGGFKIRNVDAAMITGGFVRRFMNADKNVMVSYYYDNNVNQYVKSIQKLPPSNGVNLGVKYGAGQPLVFAWIYRGKQSSY